MELLRWLWRLRNPKICIVDKLETHASWCTSSPNASWLEIEEELCFLSSSPKTVQDCYTSSVGQARGTPPAWSSASAPYYRGILTLLSWLIQMLILSRNLVTDSPVTFDQISECPVAESDWHIRVIIIGGHMGNYWAWSQGRKEKTMGRTLYCGFLGRNQVRQRKKPFLELGSLNNFSRLWAMGLSLIVWNLSLELFGQVASGPECESQTRKVGGIDFGSIGLYLKSTSQREDSS